LKLSENIVDVICSQDTSLKTFYKVLLRKNYFPQPGFGEIWITSSSSRGRRYEICLTISETQSHYL
jgi:hypothetical protein